MMLRQRVSEALRCPECGVPRWVPVFGEWTPDGLFQHRLGGFRTPPSIIIEVEEYRNIFNSLQDALGLDIGRIIAEAERQAIKAWFEDALGRLPAFLRKSSLVKRIMYRYSLLISYMSGFGTTEISSMDPDSYVIYFCRDIYDLAMATGDGQGFFEVFHGLKTAPFCMPLTNGNCVIACVRSQEPTGLEERLGYLQRKRIPGSATLERCPRCGVPLKAGNYEWDVDRGTITLRHTGWREMVAPNSGGEAVFRELLEELGEELPPVLVEIERSFTVERVRECGLGASLCGLSGLKDDTADNLEVLIADLPFRGMGNPVGFSFAEGVLRLRVDNPFNEALICGKILGFYEALEGRRGKLDYQAPEGEWAVEMEVVPA